MIKEAKVYRNYFVFAITFADIKDFRPVLFSHVVVHTGLFSKMPIFSKCHLSRAEGAKKAIFARYQIWACNVVAVCASNENYAHHHPISNKTQS